VLCAEPLVSPEFVSECVELFSTVVHVFGVPRSVGQIYGLLYSSPVPLRFSDIVERLEISKGSASQGLQLLCTLGAARVVTRPINPKRGKRDSNRGQNGRNFYEPELSIRKLVNGVLKERVNPLASTGINRLKQLRELASRDEVYQNFLLGRVKQLETWRRRLGTVLPVLSVLLGPKENK